MEFPKITLVTPSYNQGEYLRETLESVLSQNYPNLEFIVIDGGSTDESVSILKEYSDRLTYWVSEKDRGQSDALNKGFARATGEIFGWLCSDDLLEPGALETVARTFLDEQCDVVVGSCRMAYDSPESNLILTRNRADLDLLPWANTVPQPSTFFRRSLITEDNLVREDLHFVMDLELWLRIKERTNRWTFIEPVLSTYRMTGENKTSTGGRKIVAEHDRLCRSCVSQPLPMTWVYRNLFLPVHRFRCRHRSRLTWLLTRPVYSGLRNGMKVCYGSRQFKALEEFWNCFLWPEFEMLSQQGGAGSRPAK